MLKILYLTYEILRHGSSGEFQNFIICCLRKLRFLHNAFLKDKAQIILYFGFVHIFSGTHLFVFLRRPLSVADINVLTNFSINL